MTYFKVDLRFNEEVKGKEKGNKEMKLWQKRKKIMNVQTAIRA